MHRIIFIVVLNELFLECLISLQLKLGHSVIIHRTSHTAQDSIKPAFALRLVKQRLVECDTVFSKLPLQNITVLLLSSKVIGSLLNIVENNLVLI